MGRRICSVCDKPLGPGNYCGTCKRIIKNPIIISSEMRLNERHPDNESACEYHMDTSAPLGKKTSPVSHTLDSGEPKKKKKISVAAVVGVYILISFLVPFGSRVLQAVSENWELGRGTEEAVISELQTTELTPEEAMAMGVRCNSYEHLPIPKETFEGFLEAWYPANGYVLAYEDIDMENEINYYEGEEYTRFSDFKYISLNKGSEENGRYQITLSADTVTGEFHYLMANLENQEDVNQLMLDFGTLAEELLPLNQIQTRMSDSVGTLEITDEGVEVYTDYAYCYAYREGDTYYLYINGIDVSEQTD